MNKEAVQVNDEMRRALFCHFPTSFFQDLLAYFPDICANPSRYHMLGIGRSMRNALRQNIEFADDALAQNISNPIWLDNNWLGIVIGLYPYVQEKYSPSAITPIPAAVDY